MTRERLAQTKWPRRPPLTGVRLPPELVVRAKHRALDEKLTLRELVERAIRDYLSSHKG